MLTVNPEGIPVWLKSQARWMVWRVEPFGDFKPRKVPYQASNPTAKATDLDPGHWADFDTALRCYQSKGFGGISYAFPDDGIIAIDFDRWIKKGGKKRQDVLEEYRKTYREVSVSGEGVHVIGRGKRPKRWEPRDGITYPTNLAITGHHYNGSMMVLDDVPAMTAGDYLGGHQECEFEPFFGDGMDVSLDEKHIVQGFIEHSAVSLVVGEPKAGKTLFAQYLGTAVALGEDFFNRKCDQGQVVYVAAESINAIKRRQWQWKRANPGKVPPMWILRRPVALNSDAMGVGWLVDGIARLQDSTSKPVSLVIVDTLARCSVGSEENSARDMGVVMDNTDKLRRYGDMHVMLVHHKGKGDGAVYRGSSAIFGAVDTLVSINERDGVRTVKAEAQRNMESGVLGYFEIDDSGLLVPCEKPDTREFNKGAGKWQERVAKIMRDFGLRDLDDIYEKVLELENSAGDFNLKKSVKRAYESVISKEDLMF